MTGSDTGVEAATGPITVPRRRWSGRLPRPSRAVAGLVVVVVVALLLVPDLLGLDGVLPFVGFVLVRAPATLAVVVLGLLALAIRARWWPTVVPVLAIGAVSVVALVPRLIPDDPAPDPGPDLVVMVQNVDRGSADVPALAALLRERRPDVLVLPEAGEPFRERLAAAIPELGYRSWSSVPATEPDAMGTAILAGPSLGDVRATPVPARFPWLELTGGALGPTRLVGAHLASPVPGLIGVWPGELTSLARWCAPGTGPAVVLGDLNATEDIRAFRAGTTGCTDAGDAAGKGLLATWPAGLPRWLGAQLDHVLVGGGAAVEGFDVVEVPGTDHRGVLATVRVPG
ncbi:endonuclease/exonuclease/phosphatase family protein [Actinomycetospora sp. CA-084318]|uniref:endonuclease/exonuclease/phosphatase family protein n=1 Tax=Actinomycetospora sp. CA-084318 TaxID=3239892 RepID=UPI003D968D66